MRAVSRCLAYVALVPGHTCRTAACSCGWTGPQRVSLELAVDDALLHERSDHQIVKMAEDPGREVLREALRPQCSLCETGFRRVDGIHIGSQRLGMIPNTPCDQVFAAFDPKAPDLSRSWIACVDGSLLHANGGDLRRYSSATTARRAARKAAPRRWHP